MLQRSMNSTIFYKTIQISIWRTSLEV